MELKTCPMQEGVTQMSDNGKNDKGRKDTKKAPKLTLKEKRKLKNEKKNKPTSAPL
jgi:hypothetical protein